MNEYEKHLQNAEQFLNSAVIYKENDCAVDAISRAYYACFHSMLAYLHFRGKSKNLPAYIGHAELRSEVYHLQSKGKIKKLIKQRAEGQFFCQKSKFVFTYNIVQCYN